MTTRQAMNASKKVLVLGVDGLEPSLAKKFMDQGKMPALKKMVTKGAAREDLMLLGAMPTVTPPQWTTLATGAYPMTHGITAFNNPHPTKIDTIVYALNSKDCLAEQMWNVTAESGLKTLVWHWPGSSWPPSSDSENLHVVDGTQPGAVNMGVAVQDWESLIYADANLSEVAFVANDASNNPGVGCVITDIKVSDENNSLNTMDAVLGDGDLNFVITDVENESEIATLGNIHFNNCNSPIKPAEGWADAPAGAKEFTIVSAKGRFRRPALILPNADGVYDSIAIYKNKKEATALFTIQTGEIKPYYYDDMTDADGNSKKVYRSVKILELAEDGNRLRLWLSIAYDSYNNQVWHPQNLYDIIAKNIGEPQQVSTATGKVPEYAQELLIPVWDNYCDWQAQALKYCLDEMDYSVVFSHLHNVDLIGHQVWHFARHQDKWGNDEVFYQHIIEQVYVQTDRYIAEFLPYLEKDWTILLVSDHGLISERNEPPGLGEGDNNGTVMTDLGYTVWHRNENGVAEVDLSQTKAVLNRGGHILINLKGRNEGGIVEPEDYEDLVNDIISDLYNYRDPVTGKRVVGLALKNRDAAVIGLGGERCGDIMIFMEEGFNIIHMDSLSTQRGYFDTSVSPIFVAAGGGIKENYVVKRFIRQVDVAPTIAALLGVRMPRECEGAPAYSIFVNEF